ncbi:probable myosin light chain kinase DDB_G0292624 [Selaginella moellendorffii]|uniref:probable myosin light chain kinase DDB_G0292624 n=1 Tax=Selaginella moellendorffii TaxID=88036 RepID=UPI000D1CE411|nr:probable myosin light chain kinase DDB_G0292624 [Selaginella moellendorffii]|eukprot:XP_002968019.2 probable myosin light chain kinase DDB_G0292624 [Selaginella moellendorffii]
MTVWRAVESGELVVSEELSSLRKMYDVGFELGKGGQGTVHLVSFRMGGKLLAAKSFERSGEREKEIMLKLNGCHGTLEIYDMVEEELKGRWWGSLILELCSCTLRDRLKMVGRLADEEAAFVTKSLAETLREMHNLGVVHRDMKLENVLLTHPAQPYEVKLSDFGVATDRADEMHHLCGTPGYMSPDVLRAGEGGWPKYYTQAVDVWGLGLILYELVSGRVAFPEYHSDYVESLLKSVDNVEFALDWSDVSSEAKDLIMGMLEVYPSRRLTVEQVLEANAAPNKEALKFAKLLITPFTFVASTCLQSGISLIKENATPVEKGRCFHFLLASTISAFGLARCLIAIGENEQGNASEVKKLVISIWMIFLVSLSVMMTPLFFSLLYVVYDFSDAKASWSTMGACFLVGILILVGSYVKKLMRIPLRGTYITLLIIIAANSYGYTLYKK